MAPTLTHSHRQKHTSLNRRTSHFFHSVLLCLYIEYKYCVANKSLTGHRARFRPQEHETRREWCKHVMWFMMTIQVAIRWEKEWNCVAVQCVLIIRKRQNYQHYPSHALRNTKNIKNIYRELKIRNAPFYHNFTNTQKHHTSDTAILPSPSQNVAFVERIRAFSRSTHNNKISQIFSQKFKMRR